MTSTTPTATAALDPADATDARLAAEAAATDGLVRDPICGMTFAPDEAAATRVADGVTYHFCAERCARTFDRQRASRAALDAPQPARRGTAPAAPPAVRPAPAGAPARSGPASWLVPAVCLVAVGAVLAVTVFGVSTSTLLTGAVILACPLMHVFMMRGHGGHGGHSDHTAAPLDGRAQGNRPGGRGCH